MTDELERLKREGQILRSLLPKLGAPCAYCGQTNIGECERGFPGCAQADDIMCGDDEWVQEQQATIRRQAAEIAQLTEDRDLSREVVRYICAEWHEDCEPCCDSYGHDENCRATSIAAAKRALNAQVAELRAALREIANAIGDDMLYGAGYPPKVVLALVNARRLAADAPAVAPAAPEGKP
jgi:hypothetical protein